MNQEIKKFVAGMPHFSFLPEVKIDEIAENDWNLNVPRYVDTTPETEEIDVQTRMAELKQIEDKISKSSEQLESIIEGLYNE